MHQKFQMNGILGCNFTPNKIENTKELKKFDWQKPNQPNLTGSHQAYSPKENTDATKKKYNSWKK